MACIMPKTDWHPFYEKQAKAFEVNTFVRKKKILNIIGAASTGKTDFAAAFAMSIVSIWPEYSKVYVAAPFKSSAESTIWARCLSKFEEMKEANPDLWKNAEHVISKNRIEFNNLSERGFVELKTLDKVSKLQGAKAFDVTKGFMLLLLDEVALFPNLEIISLLANLRKVANFVCMSGCNFKSTQTTEGQLCEPEKREYSDLDVDVDQEWPSAYKSYTVRLDGKYSPNLIAGKILYPYLLSQLDYDESVEMYGERGPKHMEQGRSFPVDSVSDSYVTTREKIRAGGGEDDGMVFDTGRAIRVAYLDPGFGGDPAKIGVFEFSRARLQDSEGNFNTAEIFMPIEAITQLNLEVGKIADADWMTRLHKQSGGSMNTSIGLPVTLEDQMAVLSGEYLALHNVKKSHFGFDGSMRASVVQSIISVLGSQVNAIDSSGTASDRTGDLTGQKQASELYQNQVSEYWFNMAAVIQRGQFRGAKLISTAIAQLCRRKWVARGTKKQIETKADYKKGNQGKSPDDADVLCGGLEMAIRKGFAQMLRGRPQEQGDVGEVIKAMSNSDKFKKSGVKLLNR